MQNVTFDAHASGDPDGEITSYQWDFGDNSSESTTSYATTHDYALSGTYNVTLTVTDDSGLSSSVTHILRVEDVIPEYPSILTLLLTMVVTLSILILCKRNHKKK
jgi:subtilase family serine protease